MELALPLPQYESAQAAVMTARPATPADGVDISGWKNFAGSFAPVNATCFIVSGGGNDTLTKIAGASGVEVWGLKARKSGTKVWWLEGLLNGGADIAIVDPNGAAFALTFATIYDRLAVVGSAGAGTLPNFFFEPVEHIMQFVS